MRPVREENYVVSRSTVEAFQRVLGALGQIRQPLDREAYLAFLRKPTDHTLPSLAYLYAQLARPTSTEEPYASLRNRLYESPLLSALLFYVGTEQQGFVNTVAKRWPST
jgi:hypothetical protein